MNDTTFHFEPVELHADPRGYVLEPVDKESLQSQSNAHLVVTQPGAVRGNHYHRIGTEVAVIVGPALVRIRDDSEVRDIEVPDQKAWRFVFPPELPHAIQNNGSRPMVMIAFNTVVHDPAHPDVVRDVLIPHLGEAEG